MALASITLSEINQAHKTSTAWAHSYTESEKVGPIERS
jgi:hypothetical protein